MARGKVSISFGEEEWSFDRESQRKKKLETILKTAATCFNEMGYSGTSLRALAARLKVTDAALYYYVHSKEELLFLCYARALDLSERAINSATTEGTTGLEKLQLYIKFQVEAAVGSDAPVAVLSELPSLRLAHRTHIIERMNKDRKMITGFFQAGFKDRSIMKCNPRIAGAAILGALNWITRWYKDHDSHERAETADTFVQVLTRGIAGK